MKKQILLLCLLILSSSPLGCWAQGEPDVPTRELKIAGIKKNVTIRRDERGVPFIEADSEADLFFAQGFTTAQDRLWQMDLYRRVARGESAEVFGRARLEEDKRWRRFGFARIAEENLKNFAPDVRAALENYARGVNALIASLDDKSLPVEFQILQYRPRLWEPTDTIMIGKILSDALSSTWRDDLIKASLMNLPREKLAQVLDPSSPHDVLLVGKDTESVKFRIQNSKFKIQNSLLDRLAEAETVRKNSLELVGFYAENLAASNNWVVSGKRTADGKPLLANDPHLRGDAPPIWYMVNLSAPNFHVAGVTIPGTPGVVLGHNENIAWGATNVGPDVQDLYLETFDSANPRRYKTPAGWQEAETRREEIKVRKAALSPETASEFLDVVKTRNGVVFFEEGGKRYSLRWTAFDPQNNEFEAFYFNNKARNWNEFKAALKRYGGSMQNFVYADRDGNIGWYAAGRVPLRKTGDGSLPYDGAGDEGAWTGYVPFEELPQIYNPNEGIIVTANQRTVGKTYKYHDLIARTYYPYRARRILDLLSGNPKLTIDDMKAVQFDTFSIVNSRFAREIVNQKAASEDVLRLLAAWDGRMNADSKAALVTDEIRRVFRGKILASNLGAERARNVSLPNDAAFFDWIISEKPKEWLPKEFANYADLLRQSEKDARANLTKQLGADESKWSWGAVAKINLAHPLAVAPLVGSLFAIESLPQNGSGGSGATPNVGASVSMRFIAAPGNWDATRLVIPSGESGDPKSLHWKDQLNAWYTGNTPVFPFSNQSVKNATKEKLILSPQK